MAAPNVVSPTTITFKSSAVALVSGGTNLVTNASSSSTVVRIDLIQVSNVSVSAVSFSLGMNKNGSGVGFVSGSIPANSTIQYTGPFVLEENDLLSGAAVDNSKVVAFVSYQVLA